MPPGLKRKWATEDKRGDKEARKEAGRSFREKDDKGRSRGGSSVQRGGRLRRDPAGSTAGHAEGPDVQVREEEGQGTPKYGTWAMGSTGCTEDGAGSRRRREF